MKKAGAWLLTLGMVSALLAGCGSGREEVYSEYVAGVLECSYYGEFETYLESRGEEGDEAEAQAVYDATAENLVYSILYYVNADPELISDSVFEKCMELSRQVLAKAKYRVGEAEKDGDCYQVKIEIEPMDFFEIIYEPALNYLNSFNVSSGYDPDKDYTQEELAALEDAYVSGMLEAIGPCVEKIGYGEAVSKAVEVTVDNEGYGVEDEDWLEIDAMIAGWE